MGEKTLKTAGAKTSTVTKFARTSELTEEQAASGNLIGLVPGSTISGTFSSTYVDEKFRKNNFVITQLDGSNVVVAQSGNLGVKMSEVPAGSYVEITYKGKSPMKSGNFKGTLAHNWLVQYDAE